MRASLSIRAQMSVRPQLVMTSKFLQVAGSDLEQLIGSEVMANPALEMVSHFRSAGRQPARTGGVNPLSSFEERIENIAQYQSPLETLARQVLFTFDKPSQEIALNLLQRLDERGFLTVSTEELTAELGVSMKSVTRVIAMLQQLEPPGIGARDIQECFLIQCAHLEAQGMNCEKVRQILTLAWNEFLNGQWYRVAKKIKESKENVEQARQFMRLNFHPNPLALVESTEPTQNTLHFADLVIVRNSLTDPPSYSLQIPGEDDFELRLSASFAEMLKANKQTKSSLSLDDRNWMQKHFSQASLVIDALRQRWFTLRRTGECIVRHQLPFLEHGPLHLRPLTQAAVAIELNVHESTVSRAVSNKVVQLPDGHLIPLSHFFDAGVPIKETIRSFIQNSPRRLCDREIAEGLRRKGIKVSRRTVAKYRLESNLESSRRPSIPID